MTKSMTIDIGGDIHQWHPVSAMAPLIGVSTSAIYMALEDERLCNGFKLETRDVDDDLRAEFALHHSTKTVVRVSREETRMRQRDALQRAEQRLAAEKAGNDVASEDSSPNTSEELEVLRRELEESEEVMKLMSGTIELARHEIPERLQDLDLQDAVRALVIELESARNSIPANSSESPPPESDEAIRSEFDVDLEDVAWRFLADEILPHNAKSEFARVLRTRRYA